MLQPINMAAAVQARLAPGATRNSPPEGSMSRFESAPKGVRHRIATMANRLARVV